MIKMLAAGASMLVMSKRKTKKSACAGAM